MTAPLHYFNLSNIYIYIYIHLNGELDGARRFADINSFQILDYYPVHFVGVAFTLKLVVGTLTMIKHCLLIGTVAPSDWRELRPWAAIVGWFLFEPN